MGHVCPWWFAYTFDNPLRSMFHNPEKMLSPYVREGMNVADIGCGLGYFSLGLARIVKKNGRVLAIDIQQQMLERLRKRAGKSGLSEIIHPHLCQDNNIGIREPLDFALAFWMIHEAPAPETLFSQLYKSLKPSGTLMIAEPLFHVSKQEFQRELQIAINTGFTLLDKPVIRWSRAAVLKKDDKNTTAFK
jgi:ubiquinone/menaquinone biosynthesis C-methylase UbiE